MEAPWALLFAVDTTGLLLHILSSGQVSSLFFQVFTQFLFRTEMRDNKAPLAISKIHIEVTSQLSHRFYTILSRREMTGTAYQCTQGLPTGPAGSGASGPSIMSAKLTASSGTLYHSRGGEISFTAPCAS